MKRLLFVTLCLCLAGSAAQAKTLKWMDGPPGLPGGSKFAVVTGDPTKEGTFVIRAKFPAGYAVPAHHHPADERVALTAGHQVVMKADMNHWVFARSPTTVQVSGNGPFQIAYVDPKDDPRTK